MFMFEWHIGNQTIYHYEFALNISSATCPQAIRSKLLLEARGHRILRHMSPGEWCTFVKHTSQWERLVCTNSDISEQWTEVSGATLYGRINYLKPDQWPSVNPTNPDVKISISNRAKLCGPRWNTTVENCHSLRNVLAACAGITSHALQCPRLPLRRVYKDRRWIKSL